MAAACYLFFVSWSSLHRDLLLSKLNQLPVGSFSCIFVKFRGTSNYVRS